MDDFQAQLLRDLTRSIEVCVSMNPQADLAALLASLISLTASIAYTSNVLEVADGAWKSTVEALQSGEINVGDRLGSSN